MFAFCQSIQGYRFAAHQSSVLLFTQQLIDLLLALKMGLETYERTVHQEGNFQSLEH